MVISAGMEPVVLRGFFQLKDFLGYFINLFEKTGRFGTVFALFYSKVFGALKLYDERELSLCLI